VPAPGPAAVVATSGAALIAARKASADVSDVISRPDCNRDGISQPGTAYLPWLDDPAALAVAIGSFLS
jgi:hypothetical protein